MFSFSISFFLDRIQVDGDILIKKKNEVHILSISVNRKKKENVRNDELDKKCLATRRNKSEGQFYLRKERKNVKYDLYIFS
jgi:hypothetical protein